MKNIRVNLKTLLFSLLFMASTYSSFGQLGLPRLFADHMVMQRNQPIKVWGWAEPDQMVEVEMNGNRVQAKTGTDGTWLAFLPKMAAGGPFKLLVKSDTTIQFEDVWVGDVWIAGGQSNMEWQLRLTNNWEEAVANSDMPKIRFFKVPHVYSSDIETDVKSGEWKIASPTTTADFSGVAWYFSKSNHLEKNVPVGIIESNWGGTPAEAWTSIETLKQTNGYKEHALEVIDPKVDWPEIIRINKDNERKKWDLIQNKERAYKTGAQNIDFDDSDWQIINLPNSKALSDIAWLRKEINITEKVESFKFDLGRIIQNPMVFCNGQLIWTKAHPDKLAVIDVPKEVLRKGKNVIALRVNMPWDNKVWVGRDDMWVEINDTKSSLKDAWRYSNDIEPKMPSVKNLPWTPAFLYNAMIAPIAGYSARGVIWYQGESNVNKHQYYHELFTNMISDWRKAWGNQDLAFLFVQLANYLERKAEPTESNWAKLREAQTKTLAVPKTGMATIIDIGDASDIHPKNKHDVGHRLWLEARRVSFGENIVSVGPMYKSHVVKKGKVIVTFENVKNGLHLKEGKSPVGFALAGEDNKFYWANAKIEGKKVILESSSVPNPVAIRYAWADNPETNLYNSEGLPAVPFRTK